MIDIEIEITIKRAHEPVRFNISGTVDIDPKADPAEQYQVCYDAVKRVMATFPTGFAASTDRTNRQFWKTITPEVAP